MDRNERNSAQKLEGVFSRGYGVVPRSVMLLDGLTPEAKALYAYYCVTGGNSGGYQSSPCEELILKTMRISHTRFIKHRKTLVERNLISFMQPKRESGKPLFENSRFLIVKSPRESLESTSPVLSEQASLSAMASLQEGIFSQGFGLVPKMVLYDMELSVEAKAAYVFLCVFANASTSDSRSASPSSALLQEKLMTRKRIQHALSELIDSGYIRRERIHNGAFAGMLYILNFRKSPENGDKKKARDEAVFQEAQNDTAKSAVEKVVFDTAKNPYQQSLFDTADHCSKNLDDSKLSSLDTMPVSEVKNDTAKAFSYKSRNKTAEYETADYETPKNETQYINKEQRNRETNINIRHIDQEREKRRTESALADEKGTGFSFWKEEAARQIDADILSQRYGKEIIDSMVFIIADVYSAEGGKIRINGRDCDTSQAAQVYKTLKSHHIEYVLEKIAQQGEISNMQNYLYSCLYNAAISYELEMFKLSRM